MKSIFTLLCFALMTLNINAQETKKLSAFSSLNLSGDIKVELVKGEPKAEITMIKGDIDDLKVEQKGGTLTLKIKNSILWNNSISARIVLYTNDEFESMNVSAGSTLKSAEKFMVGDCSINISSGAVFNMMLEGEDLDLNVSSGASVKLEGTANSINVNVSSGGSLDGRNFETKIADANASSGGSAKIWVTDHLSANTSSGGSVKYKGDPKTTNIQAGKWSGGSVKKM